MMRIIDEKKIPRSKKLPVKTASRDYKRVARGTCSIYVVCEVRLIQSTAGQHLDNFSCMVALVARHATEQSARFAVVRSTMQCANALTLQW